MVSEVYRIKQVPTPSHERGLEHKSFRKRDHRLTCAEIKTFAYLLLSDNLFLVSHSNDYGWRERKERTERRRRDEKNSITQQGKESSGGEGSKERQRGAEMRKQRDREATCKNN